MNMSKTCKPENKMHAYGRQETYFKIIAIILVTYVQLLETKCVDKDQRKAGRCLTPECVQVAARVISAMDLKQDPCKDFYQYACGGWLKNTPIPDSKSKISVASKLSEETGKTIKNMIDDLIAKRKSSSFVAIKKAVKYYQSCMNEKLMEDRGDEPLQEIIQHYNSWPITNSSFDASTWNFEDTFTRIQKYLSMAPLFNMYVSEDIKNSTENVIIFDKGRMSIRRAFYLKNGTFHRKVRNAYKVVMKKIVKLLGANDAQVKLMDEVYDVEVKLAKMTKTLLQRRNLRSIYKTMTLEQFANATEIPAKWLTTWLDDMFRETNSTVPLSERIVTYSINYIKEAWKLFHSLRPEIQAAYIMWNPVYRLSQELRGKYKEVFEEYYNTISGTTKEPPMWQRCTRNTLGTYGFALGRLFVDEKFTTEAKETAEEMISAIREVFITNINNLNWMDEPTKVKATEKARGLLKNIGYPNFIKNDTALEMYYNRIIVHEDKYFENVLNEKSFHNLKNYAKRGQPVDKSEWSMAPSRVNGYYSGTENKIVFPAGILQPPFYDQRAIRALNYGGIGMIVGHEITHGFDNQGKKFNKEGNLQNWWTKSSEEEFQNRAQCLATQYSKYSVNGQFLNGNQTLGENIADNGGIKNSFQAYKNWVKKNGEEKQLPGLELTPDELYFVGFAQVWCSSFRPQKISLRIENGVHTIPKYRVIGSLHNSEDFSAAYKCPTGSPMNPAKKCSIW